MNTNKINKTLKTTETKFHNSNYKHMKLGIVFCATNFLFIYGNYRKYCSVTIQSNLKVFQWVIQTHPEFSILQNGATISVSDSEMNITV